jgi:RHS repeat-associated protein
MIVDGSTYYVYGAGGLPVEQINGSSTYYLLHDQLGSTRLLTDSSGSAVASNTYDPYGGLQGSTGTVTTPLGFAGAYTDAESGLLYLVNRFYDPGTGQFVSVDPLVDVTGQPYAYTGDDPVNESDPTGLAANPACTGGGPIGATPAQDRRLCTGSQQARQTEQKSPLLQQACAPPQQYSLFNTLIGSLDTNRHDAAAIGNFIWNEGAKHSARAFSNSVPGGLGNYFQNVWQSLQLLYYYAQQALSTALNPTEPVPPIE